MTKQIDQHDAATWNYLAAKALFGNDITYDATTWEVHFSSGAHIPWDPYSCDADSRRLEVSLFINVRHTSFLVPNSHTIEIGIANDWMLSAKAGPDPAATLRKMILMLATMIGINDNI